MSRGADDEGGAAGPVRAAGGGGGAASPARAAAYAALLRLRAAGARLDDSAAALPELNGLSDRDRGLANELVTGTVKRRGSVDAVLAAFTKAPLKQTDPATLEALRLAAHQLLFLDRVPAYAVVDDAVAMLAPTGRRTAGFANAVLRRVAEEGRAKLAALGDGDDARAWATRLSYPVWLVRLLRRELGDEAARALLLAGDAAPERCLRVNRLAADVPAARRALEAAGFATYGVPRLPDALLYDGPPLEPSAPFRDGLVTPQSRGSQIAALVAAAGMVSPGAPVLDLCAAPGAKTSQLAALLPQAGLTAIELDKTRVAGLRANLRRLRAGRVRVLQGDVFALPPEFDAAFDAVLLDAPCSGLGTLASRADLRWRRRAADVPRLADLQRRMLARAADTVKPGGALTYAVCTVTRAETLDVVAPLVASGAWTVDDLGAVWPGCAHPAAGGFLLVLPPEHGSAGFFVARLRRAGAAGG